MKALKLIFVSVLSVTISLSCEKDAKPIFKINLDTVFQPYMDKFFSEAKKRNIILNTITSKPLTIKFGASSSPEIPGFCEYEVNERVITIDSVIWKGLSNANKELVFFHELGHCFLDRFDHTNDFLNNFERKSMMSGLKDGVVASPTSGDYEGLKQKYYIDELFDPSVASPDWASKGKITLNSLNVKAKLDLYSLKNNLNTNEILFYNINSKITTDVQLNSIDIKTEVSAGTYVFFKNLQAAATKLAPNTNFMFDIDCIVDGSVSLFLGELKPNAANNSDFTRALGGNFSGNDSFINQYKVEFAVTSKFDIYNKPADKKLRIKLIKKEGVYYYFINDEFYNLRDWESFKNLKNTNFALLLGKGSKITLYDAKLTELQ